MKRTTLMIDEQLFRELKAKAAEMGQTLTSLVNQLLRSGLRAKPETDEKPYKLEIKPWSMQLRPGIDLSDRSTYLDLLDRPCLKQ